LWQDAGCAGKDQELLCLVSFPFALITCGHFLTRRVSSLVAEVLAIQLEAQQIHQQASGRPRKDQVTPVLDGDEEMSAAKALLQKNEKGETTCLQAAEPVNSRSEEVKVDVKLVTELIQKAVHQLLNTEVSRLRKTTLPEQGINAIMDRDWKAGSEAEDIKAGSCENKGHEKNDVDERTTKAAAQHASNDNLTTERHMPMNAARSTAPDTALKPKAPIASGVRATVAVPNQPPAFQLQLQPASSGMPTGPPRSKLHYAALTDLALREQPPQGAAPARRLYNILIPDLLAEFPSAAARLEHHGSGLPGPGRDRGKELPGLGKDGGNELPSPGRDKGKADWDSSVLGVVDLNRAIKSRSFLRLRMLSRSPSKARPGGGSPAAAAVSRPGTAAARMARPVSRAGTATGCVACIGSSLH
jgi:hypothetical protein